MTTIVYHHDAKVIAFDSRITDGSTILSDSHPKYHNFDSEDIFVCGPLADSSELIKEWNNQPYSRKLLTRWFQLDGDNVLEGHVNDEGFRVTELVNYNLAIGSGAKWAMAALDFGNNAKQAVFYAMKKDCKTGGKVNVVDV